MSALAEALVAAQAGKKVIALFELHAGSQFCDQELFYGSGNDDVGYEFIERGVDD